MNIPEDEGDTPGDRSPDPGYEVGYGRPPKANRFRKGQSGNPKGRPKGKRGLKSDLRTELTATVQVTENGRKMTLTKQRVIVKQLVAQAAKGDLRAIDKLSQILLGIFGPDDETPPASRKLAQDDAAILAAWHARRLEAGESEETGQKEGNGDGSDT
jgi:antitoxin (DNA-binding transcriptional repressor) of toxin-antitoxin stability system